MIPIQSADLLLKQRPLARTPQSRTNGLLGQKRSGRHLTPSIYHNQIKNDRGKDNGTKTGLLDGDHSGIFPSVPFIPGRNDSASGPVKVGLIFTRILGIKWAK